MAKNVNKKEKKASSNNVTKSEEHGRIMVQQRVEQHSGPIPSASALAEYGSIGIDLPNRIVKMAEKEQSGRLEAQLIKVNTDKHLAETSRIALQESSCVAKRGQIFALILVVLLIIVSVWLVTVGHPTIGGSIIGTTIFGIASVFITGRLVGGKRSDD